MSFYRHQCATLALGSAILTASAFTAGTADADLLFYANFTGFTDGSTTPAGTPSINTISGTSLDGQGGWTSPDNSAEVHDAKVGDGVNGNWDGTISGSATSGGQFLAVNGNSFGHIALDSFVTNSFAAGTTTWLSYVEYNGSGGANGRQNVAIGAAPMTDTTSTNISAQEMAGQGIGVASTTNNSPRAAYWEPNASGADKNAAATTIGGGRPLFVIAKIQWSDTGNDIITVRRTAFSIPAGFSEADWNALTTETSTSSADLDQSTFDTLSFANVNAYLDDIRIANDFNSAVTGTQVVPEPSSLALLGLGGLLIARRRRG